jgi:2-keto-3-deoxy-L-rhamnonate aldolase RhmA
MVGTFSIIPSVEVIELMGLARFDFVIIDMEHGPFTLSQVRAAIAAARAYDIRSIVRVPDGGPSMIGAVLDAGADGVLIPQVDSADVARAAVAAARFAPDGERGAHPWVSAAGYGTVPDWFAVANRETAVMVMIEGTAGIDAISEIMSVPGLDAIFLGPMDLSHSMGLPGEIDHPRVREAMEAVTHKAVAHGLATAVFAPDPGRARTWWPLGIQLVACSVDTQLARTAFAETMAAARP